MGIGACDGPNMERSFDLGWDFTVSGRARPQNPIHWLETQISECVAQAVNGLQNMPNDTGKKNSHEGQHGAE